MRRTKISAIFRHGQHKLSNNLHISSRVEMKCILYEPAALISNKADCSYCGPLLQPFCHVSALTLQKGCTNSRYVYFIRLHRRARFVRHRKPVVFVATGEECFLDIVPEGTELGSSGVLRGVWGVQNPPKFRRPYKICQTQADL